MLLLSNISNSMRAVVIESDSDSFSGFPCLHSE